MVICQHDWHEWCASMGKSGWCASKAGMVGILKPVLLVILDEIPG